MLGLVPPSKGQGLLHHCSALTKEMRAMGHLNWGEEKRESGEEDKGGERGERERNHYHLIFIPL